MPPEVEFNSAVLYRELVTHFGYAGSAQQVLRFVRPLRVAARQTRATVRFETEPGSRRRSISASVGCGLPTLRSRRISSSAR